MPFERKGRRCRAARHADQLYVPPHSHLAKGIFRFWEPDKRNMNRLLLVAVVAASLLFTPLKTQAAASASPSAQLMSKLQWRSIGPYIGGRSVAVAGVPSDPNLFYFGGVEGGVWKSTDYGLSWSNITDGKIPGVAAPIGSIAVAPSNPSVIYIGTGEADIRGDFDTGDGVYKTTNAGKTWTYAGLRDTHMIAKLARRSRQPQRGLCRLDGPRLQAERRTRHLQDDRWRRDLAQSSLRRRQHRRRRSRDGFAQSQRALRGHVAGAAPAVETHQRRTRAAPSTRAWTAARIGPRSRRIRDSRPAPSVRSASRSRRATRGSSTQSCRQVTAASSARTTPGPRGSASTPSGSCASAPSTTRRSSSIRRIPTSPTRPTSTRSTKRRTAERRGPRSARRTATTTSSGSIRAIRRFFSSVTTAAPASRPTAAIPSATDHNQPTGTVLSRRPRRSVSVPRLRRESRRRRLRRAERGDRPGIGPSEWHPVALGESTFVAPDPEDHDVTYGSGYYSSFVALNWKTGNEKNVSPWPRYMAGNSSGENDVPLRMDAPDLLLSRRSARVARRGAGRLFEHGSRTDVEDHQPRSDAQRSEHRRTDRRSRLLRSDRCGDVSRHLVARRLSARRKRVVGRFGRWARARDDRSRRSLDARDAAAASAVDADQLDRAVAYGKRDGVSHGLALYVGRLPSVRLRNDRLRRTLDNANERVARRSIRLRRSAGSARAAPALRRNAQHRLRQPRRRRRSGNRSRSIFPASRCAISRSTRAKASSSRRRTAARSGSWITSRCSSSSLTKRHSRPRACSSSRPRRRGLRTPTAAPASRNSEFRRQPEIRRGGLLQSAAGLQRLDAGDALVPRRKRRDRSELYAPPQAEARAEADARARSKPRRHPRSPARYGQVDGGRARDERLSMGSEVCSRLRLARLPHGTHRRLAGRGETDRRSCRVPTRWCCSTARRRSARR